MNLRMVITVCVLVSVGAGCSLRMELPGGDDAGSSTVNLPDAGSVDVARPIGDASPAQASGGNPGPSGNGGSGGASSATGGAGVGTGGDVATGTGGGGPATGGAQAGTGGAQASNPDSGVDGPLSMRGFGETCSSKNDCASGNCADGVCCDTACTDSCSACNLANFVGHCSPVAAGGVAPAPHPACPKMPSSTCQQNGLCDGKGACQLYASGESCAGGACSAATQMSVTGSMCDGVGACKAAPAVACSPFKCKADGTACATTCTTDADCQGQPCVAGSCGKVANGNKCTSAAQCTSGNCVDGYCCDLACGGSCQACDLAGSIGKCTTLAANQTPRNGRAACAAGTCGSRCDGTSTSCVFAPKTTSCGAASCSGGTVKAAVSCDGMGACPTAATTSCGGYVCSGAACKTSCAADADCLSPTPYCSGGKCQAAKPLGRACTTGNECAMGNCVNGVCCGTASCPTCQACNLGTPGTCTAKPAGTADSACTAANCQTGTCNASGACAQAADGAMCGTNRFCRGGTCGACTPNQTCQPPTNPCKTGTTSCTTGSMTCLESGNMGAGTPCGAGASCTGSTKTNAAVCNGSGTCSATTMTCANGCNPAKTDCLMCSAGQTACSGACVDTTSNAAHCGSGCAPCGGATPVCVNSTCVQCTSDANCAGTTRVSCDTSSHKCVCRRKSGGNVLSNSGFDTAAQVVGSTNWIDPDPVLGEVWSSVDADNCPESGSAFGTIYAASPCIQVTPGATYYFGLRYQNLTGCGLQCLVASCGSTPLMSPVLTLPLATSWQSAGSSWLIPAVVSSVRFSCVGGCADGSPAQGYVDQLYLNGSAASF